MFARRFTATVSRPRRSIDKLARGGNARNLASTCRAFHWKMSIKNDEVERVFGNALVRMRRSRICLASSSPPARKSLRLGEEKPIHLEPDRAANIFRRHAEGRTDRDGRHSDPGFAWNDVPGRSRGSA